MKKNILLAGIFIITATSSASAQSIFDKIDRIANSVDRTANKVERAANTADRTIQTGSKLKNLVSKKSDTRNSLDVNNTSENQTQIILLNTDLASAKKLNSVLESSKNVSSSQMKFGSGKSTITVIHSGSSDNLLNTIQPKAKDIFTEQNIQEFEDGKITIKL